MLGFAGLGYGVTSVLAGGAFLFLAFRLFLTKDEADARRLFRFSILYLFALFAALGLESLMRGMI